MNVFSGHRIDPLHIKEDDIHLEDIAHALSLIFEEMVILNISTLWLSMLSTVRKKHKAEDIVNMLFYHVYFMMQVKPI